MGGWPGGHLHNAVEELKSGLPRTNPDNGREEDLKQGPLILNPALLKPLGSAASLKLNQYHQIKLFDQGCKFVLFDVESLFTNVPLQRTLKIMLDRIHNKTWSKQTSRNPTLWKLICNCDTFTKTASPCNCQRLRTNRCSEHGWIVRFSIVYYYDNDRFWRNNPNLLIAE